MGVSGEWSGFVEHVSTFEAHLCELCSGGRKGEGMHYTTSA